MVFFVIALVWFLRGRRWAIPRVSLPLALIVLFAALTFFQGALSAPNTTDSMVYHLVRVVFWMQEQTAWQSVRITSHDFMPPLSGYIMTHLYLLADSDRFVFLGQWLSYLGVIMCGAELLHHWRASKSLHDWPLLVVASIPLLVLQASSTQNDLLLTFLTLSSVLFAVRYRKHEKRTDLLFLCLALSLGVFAKTSFVLWAWWIVLRALWKGRAVQWKALGIIMAIGLITLILQSHFWIQNMRLFGSPLGRHITQAGEIVYTNEKMSVGIAAGLLFRNLALNMPLPALSGSITKMATQLFSRFGVDLNDPATTWTGSTFAIQSIVYPQEDIASAPLQVLILIVGGVILWKKRSEASESALVLVGVLVSFFLFSLLLKWQPYHLRLQLPFFAVGLVAVLPLMSHHAKKYLKLTALLCSLLGLACILLNVSRPYISYKQFGSVVQQWQPAGSELPRSFLTTPRYEQYFRARPYWLKPYTQTAVEIKRLSAGEVSLDLEDGFAYPLVVALRRELPNIHITYDNKTTVVKSYTSEHESGTCIKAAQWKCVIVLP